MADSVMSASAGYVFDPSRPGFAEDPYPFYAELRAKDPVHEHPLGYWVLGMHADVFALLRSGHSVEDRNARAIPMRKLREDAVGGEYRAVAPTMLDRDPPDHTRLRKLVTKAFTKRAVDALEPRVTELVDAALARIERRIADTGRADVVEELAYPLPMTVISELLGMPDTDHTRLRELASMVVRRLDQVTDPELIQAIAAAGAELSARITDVVDHKRGLPGDDVLTALIRAEDDGDVLTDEELVAQVVLLYVAGHETTVNLIANGTLALLRHPDQFALLAARPDLDANAVEELLRYESPVHQSRRITLSPCRVRGREIPEGSFVLAALASANRDAEFWGPDADELKLDRANARSHMCFGSGGAHHCLGASLARLEGRIAIGRLVRRFPTLALADTITWNGRINVRGPLALPVTA